jgi:cystathionine beta-synthase
MLQVAERFGPEATLVTLIPDGGRGYLSKFFDDNWLMEYGFLERRGAAPTIAQVLAFKRDVPQLVAVESHEKVGRAVELMQRYGISQIPVVRHAPAESLADFVGALHERGLLERVFRNPDSLNEDVATAMEPPLRAVELGESVETVYADLAGAGSGVVVADAGKPLGVLTRADLLEYLAHHRAQDGA